jgi:stage II sporulation protein D
MHHTTTVVTSNIDRRKLLVAAAAGAVAALLPVGRGRAAPGDSVLVRDPAGSAATVPVEEYLKAVVATEVPASWPIEALKAQAVAARSYLAAYVGRNQAICSTTACQAWNPSRRNARADAAVDATRGQILTYQGEPIWAYYSSTCGGQTAAGAQPYCQSVRCWLEPGTTVDLRGEAAAAAFWADGSQPALCGGSPAYRYRWSLGVDELAANLRRYLPALPGVSPRYEGADLGPLRDLAVAERAASGKAARLRIVGAGDAWDVVGEMSIRSLLRSGPAVQRSANLVLALARDGSGAVTGLEGRGGGYGHGIGLCQFGARGMAERGRDYRAILAHYYAGVELVTG